MEEKQWWIYDLMEERVEVIFNLQSSSFLSFIFKKLGGTPLLWRW
jgi:hypothetical protein